MSLSDSTPPVERRAHRRHGAPPAPEPSRWLAAIPGAAGVVLYLNTVPHGYVLDDVAVITNNPSVAAGLRGIPEIFKTALWHFDNVNLGYYRPLSLVTFAVEQQLFPGNPHVGHLGNVILFGLACATVYLLLASVFRQWPPRWSLLAALLFAAHPIHTEVVANIKSRDELLAFVLLVVALVLLQANDRRERSRPLANGRLTLSLFVYYLALLSKETALIGVLIAPLVLYAGGHRSLRHCLVRASPLALMVLLFQAQKYAALGTLWGTVPADVVNYPYADPAVRIPSMFVLCLWALKLLAVPYPLAYDYSFNQIPAAHWSTPAALAGAILFLALGACSIGGLRRRSPLACGGMVLCIGLAPALAFAFLRGGVLSERLLFASSLGWCMALAALLTMTTDRGQSSAGGRRRSVLPVSCAAMVFVSYALLTVARNAAWKDNLTLFSTDVRTATNSCLVHQHYGHELIRVAAAEPDPVRRRHLFDHGSAQVHEALRIHPHFGEAFFVLGFAHQAVEPDADRAIAYYERAIQAAPSYADSYGNLGVLLANRGKEAVASYYFNKAAALNPYSPVGARNSATIKARTGIDVCVFPSSGSVESVERVLERRDKHLYYTVGTEYAAQGEWAAAIRCLEMAVQIDPAFEAARARLAQGHAMLGRTPGRAGRPD